MMASTGHHFLGGKKVIIAGAGISGLSFAVALRKLWPSELPTPTIVILDRDSREGSVTRQGYSLSLHGQDETGGLYALRQLGLLDQILEHAVINAADGNGCFKMWTSDWTPMISIRAKPGAGLPTSSIRIRRADLRRILTEAVEDLYEVRWGQSCTAATQLEGDRVRVTLKDATTGEQHEEECDLLVAADGASSKVRASIRPGDELEYRGAVQMGGVAVFEDKPPHPVDRDWGGVISGKGVFLFASLVDERSVIWALSVMAPEPQVKYDSQDPLHVESMLGEAAHIGKVLKEPFQTLLKHTQSSTTLKISARDKRPFHHDESTGSIVFIGDSNHAVSPFAGNGANMALKDGWDLAEDLLQSGSLADALNKYDEKSVKRALVSLKTSHSRIKMGHASGLTYVVYRIFLGVAGWIMKLTGQG